MSAALPTSPATAPSTGRPRRFLVVAFWLPPARVVTASLHAEFIGATLLARGLARALEHERVPFEGGAVLSAALSRAVWCCVVSDARPALEVLWKEVQGMEMERWCVIGVRDKAEGFYRTLAPEKPSFDLDRRMRSVYPLTESGDFSGATPEMGELRVALEKKRADDLAYFRSLGFCPPENPS